MNIGIFLTSKSSESCYLAMLQLILQTKKPQWFL